MKTTARILTVLLALALVMSLPLAAFAATEEKVYVLEASSLEPFAKDTKAVGDTVVCGTDNYFTIICNNNTRVDASDKEFSDGYTSNQRINIGGKTQFKTPDGQTEKVLVNSVKFTTTGKATVKIWWVANGDDFRPVEIWNPAGEKVVGVDGVAKGEKVISEMQLAEAGTYHVAMPVNGNYIFKIEVTQTVTIPDAPKNGDPIGVVAALLAVSGAALFVLPRKKRA
jgi:hypothetical protein